MEALSGNKVFRGKKGQKMENFEKLQLTLQRSSIDVATLR